VSPASLPIQGGMRKDSLFMAVEPGNALAALLEAQQHDDRAVSYPHIETYARQIIDWASHFDRPLLVPVGDGARRLLGAVELLSHGQVETSAWSRDVQGRDVLLVGTVTASLIEFEMEASILRRQGAHSIHGCAIEVSATTASEGLDSFYLLSSRTQPIRQSA
jgi:hypothetical protein